MAKRRKFIFYGAISIDGFIARPDGSVDWLDRPRPKGNYGMGAFYGSIDTCVVDAKGGFGISILGNEGSRDRSIALAGIVESRR